MIALLLVAAFKFMPCDSLEFSHDLRTWCSPPRCQRTDSNPLRKWYEVKRLDGWEFARVVRSYRHNTPCGGSEVPPDSVTIEGVEFRYYADGQLHAVALTRREIEWLKGIIPEAR